MLVVVIQRAHTHPETSDLVSTVNPDTYMNNLIHAGQLWGFPPVLILNMKKDIYFCAFFDASLWYSVILVVVSFTSLLKCYLVKHFGHVSAI